MNFELSLHLRTTLLGLSGKTFEYYHCEQNVAGAYIFLCDRLKI